MKITKDGPEMLAKLQALSYKLQVERSELKIGVSQIPPLPGLPP
jgi:hypothetical protein